MQCYSRRFSARFSLWKFFCFCSSNLGLGFSKQRKIESVIHPNGAQEIKGGLWAPVLSIPNEPIEKLL